MFGLFKPKKKPLLSAAEQERIVAAVQEAERNTSGEIRVYMESRCAYVDSMDRAREVFFKLKMQETSNHNAVLVYIALVDRQLALYGDEGIHRKTGGDPYWRQEVQLLRRFFQENRIAEGIATCVQHIGMSLSEHFPYDSKTDKNELPDDIVFGD
ncbi:TPM domain-containing protein [Taibaiella chishuiensis]|uniref:TLP18.3/Psb32/MOLO-1 phosphatase superfamily protein n=1 Tax=Taibaiella chishuiensis TaxID=1434707 RepID=A0A2P8CXR9_9BACT|nr:TPM domain-containing protein [Taibaiella chishuiensis]PSK89727.1 TLP18.3/Psb32/MOLO-1 phosphatase superfamily protein [Taibaiella chishuiensis]